VSAAEPGAARDSLTEPESTAGTAQPSADSIRVLLVDDQKLFRAGIAVIVDNQPGMHVVGEAGDGFEALECVERLRPDVVLMDIRMPEMDGVEATRRIFEPVPGDPFRQPPRVIVLTTFNLDDRAARAIRHGASGFLLKDSSPAQLGDAVRTVHSGNAVLAPADLAMLLDGEFSMTPVPETPQAYLELTSRELDIFAEAARGLANAEIAASMFLSESTVKTHLSSILRKLDLRDRVQLVVYAHEHSLPR
jgi:DNA-binding NarL/FixJ family response regulator